MKRDNNTYAPSKTEYSLQGNRRELTSPSIQYLEGLTELVQRFADRVESREKTPNPVMLLIFMVMCYGMWMWCIMWAIAQMTQQPWTPWPWNLPVATISALIMWRLRSFMYRRGRTTGS